MKPQPFYTPTNLCGAAFNLKYSWTGWPSSGQFPSSFLSSENSFPDDEWEADGFRRMETAISGNQVKILFSVKPDVSPTFFTSRVKGRLQNSLWKNGHSLKFSRKVGFRSIGDNKTDEVDRYISSQVLKEQFIDQRYSEKLAKFTGSSNDLDLKIPTATSSGRYWYNLHLVLVSHQRHKLSLKHLAKIQSGIQSIATKRGNELATWSVMPDHMHLSMRGNIYSSPAEIALCFMNNLSHKLGFPIWQSGYYVGSFGEYDLGAIRSLLNRQK